MEAVVLLSLLSLGFIASVLVDGFSNDDGEGTSDVDSESPDEGTQGTESILSTLSFDAQSSSDSEFVIEDVSYELISDTYGDEMLQGAAWDELLSGAYGSDTLDGGAGDDVLDATDDPADPGADVLIGGEGDDLLIGDDGDSMSGGEGEDDFVIGWQEGDEPLLITDFNVADGESIGVVMNALPADAQLDLVDLDDGSGTALMLGSMHVATLAGVQAADVPEDSIYLIDSADAPDLLIDGPDDGNIDAGGGDDTLLGGAGDDTLDGGAGNDFIAGDAGDDVIYGGTGDDQLTDSEGSDTLTGGEGNDQIYAVDAPDAPGADLIAGGIGDDLLIGDNGDIFTGGEGSDIFHNIVTWHNAMAPVRVTDFVPEEDALVINFYDGPAVGYSLALSNDGMSTEVIAGGAVRAILEGLTPEDLAGTRIQVVSH